MNSALERLSKMLEKRPSNILIVEDDAAQRHGLGERSPHGRHRDRRPSAEEALEKLAAQSFDGMVLDLGLPGASGFELVERLSKSPDLEGAPSRHLHEPRALSHRGKCS